MQKDELNNLKPKEVLVNQKVKRYSYGKLLITFAIISVVWNSYINNFISPHSLATVIIVSLTPTLLGVCLLYFLTLLIIDSIRRRGKIDRPYSKKTRLVVNIIFIVMFIIIISSTLLSVYRSPKTDSTRLTPQQLAYMQEALNKSDELAEQNDKVKITTKSFIDTINSGDFSELHSELENLFLETQKLQPKLDELKVFTQQNLNLFDDTVVKEYMTLYAKSVDVRERDNKKLSELAFYGLKIDWSKPTKEELSEWTKLADELSLVDRELLQVQDEFQTMTNNIGNYK